MKKRLTKFNQYQLIHGGPNQYLPILRNINLFGLVKYQLTLVEIG